MNWNEKQLETKEKLTKEGWKEKLLEFLRTFSFKEYNNVN